MVLSCGGGWMVDKLSYLESEREASKTHKLTHISHIQIFHLFLLSTSIRSDGDRS